MSSVGDWSQKTGESRKVVTIFYNIYYNNSSRVIHSRTVSLEHLDSYTLEMGGACDSEDRYHIIVIINFKTRYSFNVNMSE